MKLTAEQYWNWMTSIEKMGHEQTKLQLKQTTAALMQKDLEVAQLKQHIFKEQIRQQEVRLADAKREYEELKAHIEASLGFSLNGCSINDLYEVVRLEE